ncbi:MAG TPA: NAD(P)/FAD-dependent oxidoreductase [Gammaproteobacteria bacterium]|nr:NAD(P)/FAD-dependent oxidoreductase [Gammaproteobacteria bacterium]
MDAPHKIVIVGGGAGGLELATHLGNRLGRRAHAEVTLVDAEWTHVWKPLLHEVAAGSLDVGENALEFLAQARRHHFRFRLGYVDGVDRDARRVGLAPMYNDHGQEITPRRTLPYDTLVLAVGSVTNDLGVEGVQEHCLFLDTTRQAERFQQTLLGRLLHAHAQGGPRAPSELDVAIVGGGATGVELSAQLHDVTRQLAAYGLDELRPDEHIRLHVIQAGPRLVPALPERLSAATARALEDLGIRVHCNSRVSKVTAEGVYTNDDEFIPAAIKVWAAGIKAPDWLGSIDGLETTKGNQIRVERSLQSTADENIFALGDCAACPRSDDDDWVPPRAQAAHQEAAFLARGLRARLSGKPLPQYRYRDYGSLIALGRYTTVGSLMGSLIGTIGVSGTFARLIYLWLYKSHQITLHGWTRTILLNIANLLRRGVDPRIKLH